MKKMGLIALVALLAGCVTASKPNDVAQSEDAALAIRNQGYSLLYKLMADEKNVSKILLVKKEQADLGELIKRIAKVTGEAAAQIEAFAKADGHLHLKMD